MSILPVSRIVQACTLVLLIHSVVSCSSAKKARQELKYLQQDMSASANAKITVPEITIQKGDLLSIFVYSDNPEATAIFNQAASKTDGAVPGYLVNQEGNIRFQTLGELHVEGMTKRDLTKLMDDKLKNYLQNPYTDIRFLNFKVSVIGEVNKPGLITIPEGKLTILEVVSLAGDLTVFGRRDNILVIREGNGKREIGRISLQDPALFQSPYFNLQQNDVVMVDANNKKPTGTEQELYRNLTIVSAFASVVSIGAVIYNIFNNN